MEIHQLQKGCLLQEKFNAHQFMEQTGQEPIVCQISLFLGELLLKLQVKLASLEKSRKNSPNLQEINLLSGQKILGKVKDSIRFQKPGEICRELCKVMLLSLESKSHWKKELKKWMIHLLKASKFISMIRDQFGILILSKLQSQTI